MNKNGKFLHELYTSAELELVNSSEKCKGTFTRINNKNCFENSVLDHAFCSPSFYKYVVSLCINNLKVQTACRFLKEGDRPFDHCPMITEIRIPKRRHFCRKEKDCVELSG